LEFMNLENIILEKKNAIAYVTVNRPKVLNALNMATMEELRAAFHDIKNDAGPILASWLNKMPSPARNIPIAGRTC
jgi:enoyl-CoA hydratase/carnithine racemase